MVSFFLISGRGVRPELRLVSQRLMARSVMGLVAGSNLRERTVHCFVSNKEFGNEMKGKKKHLEGLEDN